MFAGMALCVATCPKVVVGVSVAPNEWVLQHVIPHLKGTRENVRFDDPKVFSDDLDLEAFSTLYETGAGWQPHFVRKASGKITVKPNRCFDMNSCGYGDPQAGDVLRLDKDGEYRVLVYLGEDTFPHLRAKGKTTTPTSSMSFFAYPFMPSILRQMEWNTFPPRYHDRLARIIYDKSAGLYFQPTDIERKTNWLRTDLTDRARVGVHNKYYYLPRHWTSGTSYEVFRYQHSVNREVTFVKRLEDLVCHLQRYRSSCVFAVYSDARGYVEPKSKANLNPLAYEMELTNKYIRQMDLFKWRKMAEAYAIKIDDPDLYQRVQGDSELEEFRDEVMDSIWHQPRTPATREPLGSWFQVAGNQHIFENEMKARRIVVTSNIKSVMTEVKKQLLNDIPVMATKENHRLTTLPCPGLSLQPSDVHDPYKFCSLFRTKTFTGERVNPGTHRILIVGMERIRRGDAMQRVSYFIQDGEQLDSTSIGFGGKNMSRVTLGDALLDIAEGKSSPPVVHIYRISAEDFEKVHWRTKKKGGSHILYVYDGS